MTNTYIWISFITFLIQGIANLITSKGKGSTVVAGIILLAIGIYGIICLQYV